MRKSFNDANAAPQQSIISLLSFPLSSCCSSHVTYHAMKFIEGFIGYTLLRDISPVTRQKNALHRACQPNFTSIFDRPTKKAYLSLSLEAEYLA